MPRPSDCDAAHAQHQAALFKLDLFPSLCVCEEVVHFVREMGPALLRRVGELAAENAELRRQLAAREDDGR